MTTGCVRSARRYTSRSAARTEQQWGVEAPWPSEPRASAVGSGVDGLERRELGNGAKPSCSIIVAAALLPTVPIRADECTKKLTAARSRPLFLTDDDCKLWFSTVAVNGYSACKRGANDVGTREALYDLVQDAERFVVVLAPSQDRSQPNELPASVVVATRERRDARASNEC